MKKLLIVITLVLGVAVGNSFSEWCTESTVKSIQNRKDGVTYIELTDYTTKLKLYSSAAGAKQILSTALTALSTGQKVTFTLPSCTNESETDWDSFKIVN